MRLALNILWASFLAAIVAEGLFFSHFNPSDLVVSVAQQELRPIAVYTLGFFFFWGLCALASLLTSVLLRDPRATRNDADELRARDVAEPAGPD